MNPIAGWLLAAIALFVGWQQWRWQGVVLAITVIAFWLILQFNRALRVMRTAAAAPIGHVGSAVMLNARLRRGLALWEIVAMTRSLGQPADDGEAFVWRDAGGTEVRARMSRGRLADWRLVRADSAPPK